MNERFGEVRALCHEPADEHSWVRLCELLDDVPIEALREVYLPYLATHLERWVAICRVAPWRWLEGALRRDAASIEKLSIARVIDLSWRQLRLDRFKRLLEHVPWTHITHLYLESCRLSPAMLSRLVQYEPLEHLEVLGLARNALSHAGAEALGQASTLNRLRVLDLEGCFFDGLDVASILDNRCFARLEQLDLSGNILGVEAMEALAGCPQRHTLELLNMTRCIAGDGARVARGGALLEVLTGYVEAPWPALRQLELGYWGLDADSVSVLDSLMCQGLETLDLNGSVLDARGARQLAACQALERLEVLDLRRNRLDDEGAQALVAPDAMLRSLRKVSLGWNRLSASMVQRLRRAGLEVDLTG